MKRMDEVGASGPGFPASADDVRTSSPVHADTKSGVEADGAPCPAGPSAFNAGGAASWMLAVTALQGDKSECFSLDLADVAMRHFVDVYRSADLTDDYVFHGSLRWLYAMSMFLGSERFQRDLAESLGSSDSSVCRWVKGQSVPAARLRRPIISSAFILVRKCREARGRGVDLFNSNWSETVADDNQVDMPRPA